MSRSWERALVVLGICLPVPLCAATGLSIPLPGPVERIAAGLVPWADSATLDANAALTRGAGGSIVFAPGERSAEQSDDPDRGDLADGRSESGGSGSADGEPSKTKDEGKDQDPVKTDPGGTDPGGTDPGGTDPGGDPSPVDDTVNQVTETTDPVVDEVEGTVTGIVDTGETEGTVDGLVSGLGK